MLQNISENENDLIFFRDQSIPAVESVASDERSSLELDYLSRLMEEHTAIEGSLVTIFLRLMNPVT
jgi:hypothetical protein